MNRRQVLRFFGLGAGLALAAACAPIAPANAPTTTTGSGTGPVGTTVSVSTPSAKPPTAAEPQKGGSFRVGMVGDAARLDGQLVTTVDATWAPFDRLTAYDKDLKPQPM